MEEIKYFVFFDLETTGLPFPENNQTKITELSMVAVSRNNLLSSNGKEVPRVTHKVSLCFDPKRKIHHESSEITGLWNFLLDGESSFNENDMKLINSFLERLEKPVCLVAHNGFNFDYSIFNTHILNSKSKLIEGVFCIDSIPLFQHVLNNENEKKTEAIDGNDIFKTPTKITVEKGQNVIGNQSSEDENIVKLLETSTDDQLLKSSVMLTPTKTPLKRKSNGLLVNETSPGSSVGSVNKKSPKNYKLQEVYHFLFGEYPLDTHRAECDCMILLECCVKKAKDFINWCDENKVNLNEIECMEVGKEFPKFTPKKSCVRVLYSE